IANNIVKTIIKAKQEISTVKIAILGMTFKENVADVRNTKVIDIVKELNDYGIEVLVHDPVAEAQEVYDVFNIKLVDENALQDLDCLIFAVPHEVFKETYTLDKIKSLYRTDNKVLIDIKSLFDKNACEAEGFKYWSL